MVHQKALVGLLSIFGQVPRAFPFADRVPRPNRLGVHAVHYTCDRLDLGVTAGEIDPVARLDPLRLSQLAWNIERVPAMNLPEPRIH